MYCVKCGEQISDDSKFCSKCGNKIKYTALGELRENNKEEKVANVEQNKKNIELKYILLGIAGLLIAIIIIVIAVGSTKIKLLKNNSSNAEVTMEETPIVPTDYLLLKKTIYYPNGEPESIQRFSYYTDGKIKEDCLEICVTETMSKHNPNSSAGYVNCFYDETKTQNTVGVIKVKTLGKDNAHISGTIEAVYDDNNRLIMLNSYGNEGDTELNSFKYDDRGNQIEWIYKRDNNVIDKRNYTYNDQNILTEMNEVFEKDGKIVKDKFIYTYEYGDNNLPCVQYEYNENKNETIITKLTRNESGLVVREERERERIDGEILRDITEYEYCKLEEYNKLEEQQNTDINEKRGNESGSNIRKKNEIIKEQEETKKEEKVVEEMDEYILPESDSRKLVEGDLDRLTPSECRYARNEIYARHGRKFRDVELQAYFDQQSWYKGSIEAKDWDEYTLNEIESYNRDFIVKYEKKKGYN